jgi:hypothetical protein
MPIDIQTILVATDFSTASEAAMTYAFQLVRSLGVRVYLLHVVLESDVDLTTVKELLGHKSLSMTLRYAHLTPSHKMKAVSVLEASLRQKPTVQKHSVTKKGFAKIG